MSTELKVCKMYNSSFYIVIDVVIIESTTYVESTLQEHSLTVFMLETCKLCIVDLSPCCQVYLVCICIMYVLVWQLALLLHIHEVCSLNFSKVTDYPNCMVLLNLLIFNKIIMMLIEIMNVCMLVAGSTNSASSWICHQ